MKFSFKEVLKTLPLLIAAGLVLISVIQVALQPTIVNEHNQTVTYVMQNSTIAAAIGLGIVMLLSLKKDYWKYGFAVLLVVGLLPFIQFYDRVQYTAAIGHLKFDVIAAGLLILHLGLNLESTQGNDKRLQDH